MNNSKKTTYAFVFFVAVLALSILSSPRVLATELTAQEKTLKLLSDVATLNLSNYNVTFRQYKISYPDEYGGAVEEEVRYTLQGDGSYLAGSCIFIKGSLCSLMQEWQEGSPIYTQPPPSNVIDHAKSVLERYQAYIESSRYQPMRDILDSVSKAESATIISGNLKLRIDFNGPHKVDFDWIYSIDGVERIMFDITFWDGNLYGIGDETGVYTISDSEVTVSEEEAVAMAIEEALSCSWKASIDGEDVTADGISSLHAPTAGLSLRVHPSRDPFVYFPFWLVNVWLDRTYLGGVSVIDVGIWADTGEVLYVLPLGAGGGFSTSGGGSSSSSSSGTTPSGSGSADQDSPATQLFLLSSLFMSNLKYEENPVEERFLSWRCL